MKNATFTTTFTEKIPLVGDLAGFRFVKPEGFTYSAGQWFTITIPSPSGPLKKPFTYSSSPTEPFLQLTTRLSGSDFKNALDSLTPGAPVDMQGVFGNFTLKPGLTKLAFLAGGIGVTPIRSILRYLTDTGGGGLEIVVFYGNLDEDNIPFKGEFDEFEQKLPGVRVVHVLSQPADDWAGYKGFITAEVIGRELGDAAAWTFYTSGPPPMVAAMRTALETLAVPPERQVEESFGPPAKPAT
ncbi:MAG: FAD-dependent oxidoreductase [Actinobacteria bacterium]|nr:FAD-dependent oxidoreductase [Actinomycetota bacterium]